MTNDELFEKFIERQLSAEEKKLFELRVQTDKDFAIRVRNSMYLLALIREKESKEIEKELSEISPRPVIIKKYTYSLYATVAAACVLLFCLVTWWRWQPTETLHEVAQHYYENPKRNLEIKADIPVAGDSLEQYRKGEFEKGAKLFEQQKYAEASRIFQVLKNQKPVSDYTYFYEAICQYELKAYTVSVANLDTLYHRSPDMKLRYTSKWYQALAYLQLENTTQAKNILQELQLPSTDNLYHEKAKNILQEIDK